MFRRSSQLLAALACVGFVANANAGQIINFDANGAGGGGSKKVETFDFNPGNVLAVDGGSPGGVPPAVGDFQDLYYQARLGSFTNGGVVNFPGLNTNFEFTIVAGFTEEIAVSAGGIVAGVLAGVADQNVNFFEIWFNDTAATFADNLAGTGFGIGTKILSGSVSSLSALFAVTGGGPASGVLFDQAGGSDDYGGLETLTGLGAFDVAASVDFVDPAFFKDGLTALTLALANGNLNLPFTQVDPSRLFNDGTGAGTLAPSLGPFNGGGDDFQFQADTNVSYENFDQPDVPEPATCVLWGIGFAGLALMNRRRRNKVVA